MLKAKKNAEKRTIDEQKRKITELENALQIVLDCYAAQIPTSSILIDSIKESINWSPEDARARYKERSV